MSIPRRTNRLSKATLAEARWAQSEANRLRRITPDLEAQEQKHLAKLQDYRAQLARGAQYDRSGAPLSACIGAEWSHLKYVRQCLVNDLETLADTKRLLAQWEGIVADIEGARAIFEQGKLV